VPQTSWQFSARHTTVMYGERKHTIFCQFSVTDDGSFVCSLGTRGRCEEKTVNVSAAL